MDSHGDKPLVWLQSEIRTPPWGVSARREAGFMLRQLQQGAQLGMPHSRPMPAVGSRCHELRVRDASENWRVVYRLDSDAVVVLAVFPKASRTTPDWILRACRRRLARYDRSIRG